MPNVESLNQHNKNYISNDAFEKEKRAHLEKNSNDFKFLYQEDIPPVSYTHLTLPTILRV